MPDQMLPASQMDFSCVRIDGSHPASQTDFDGVRSDGSQDGTSQASSDESVPLPNSEGDLGAWIDAHSPELFVLTSTIGFTFISGPFLTPGTFGLSEILVNKLEFRKFMQECSEDQYYGEEPASKELRVSLRALARMCGDSVEYTATCTVDFCREPPEQLVANFPSLFQLCYIVFKDIRQAKVRRQGTRSASRAHRNSHSRTASPQERCSAEQGGYSNAVPADIIGASDPMGPLPGRGAPSGSSMTKLSM
eukprot:gnl/TRDRNA2_/TRDRNA2_176343_c1_seq2.p1 gnl/TRDRNA2_/TRDRNA2_176343_c1~~gnl/TRDRNA2_/TRDRNA2_176343_c1_seq2.p1  ORF type:complete len:272 (-),score=33.30 gnl/TRDRNA2_/TRDRNA2_176343_c1_seq2:78-827(-)